MDKPLTSDDLPLRPAQIAIFTDFGEVGPYTGLMEAVLISQGVNIPIIRLLTDAPTYNPRASAYILEPLAQHMPAPTLFLSVVDPGVGGARLPLLIQTERHWFVGPDNGLFSQVLRHSIDANVQNIEWRPSRLSASFHGRDLFAPVAAAIALGREISLLPVMAAELVGLDWPDFLAEIIYLDHYGNAFTGLKADDLQQDAVLLVGGVEIGSARTFGEIARGAPFWYRNSIGLVEIAVNQGHADQLLGLEVGLPIQVLSER